jgi:hypothetical protein
MNDRFESLMYHAGMTAQGCWDEMDSYQREAVERFALLIVQDCLLSLEPNSMAPEIDYDVEEKFYQRSARKIKQHFGIE